MSGRKALTKVKTLAELLHRLGDVPPERIRFKPLPGTATVKDVIEIEAHEDRLCELVDGVLVEKPMGFTESRIALLLGTALQNFMNEHDLGVVTGESGMIRMPSNLIRMPDVAFFAWRHFPQRELPEESAPEIAPDLAVEVLSKTNTPREMERKLGEYFSAGVRLVWFIDPAARSATIFTSPARSTVISSRDALDGGKILPGFKLRLAELFASLRAPPSKRKKR
jgi:Uma2 family endonuclease